MSESDIKETLECKSCGFVVDAETYNNPTCPNCGAGWDANKHVTISVPNFTVFAVVDGGQNG